MSTRQTLASSSINELHYVMNKALFVRSASLGKLQKPLQKIRSRVEKHICAESGLLEMTWEDITVSEGGCDER